MPDRFVPLAARPSHLGPRTLDQDMFELGYSERLAARQHRPA
jgi:hypothetical protein